MRRLELQLKEALDSNDAETVVYLLDDTKGSYAVKTVLEYLLSRGQTHTLQSVIELLQRKTEK